MCQDVDTTCFSIIQLGFTNAADFACLEEGIHQNLGSGHHCLMLIGCGATGWSLQHGNSPGKQDSISFHAALRLQRSILNF